jgi:hypothetical protein
MWYALVQPRTKSQLLLRWIERHRYDPNQCPITTPLQKKPPKEHKYRSKNPNKKITPSLYKYVNKFRAKFLQFMLQKEGMNRHCMKPA